MFLLQHGDSVKRLCRNHVHPTPCSRSQARQVCPGSASCTRVRSLSRQTLLENLLPFPRPAPAAARRCESLRHSHGLSDNRLAKESSARPTNSLKVRTNCCGCAYVYFFLRGSPFFHQVLKCAHEAILLLFSTYAPLPFCPLILFK